MLEFRTKIKLHDTDAAGLLFYGRQFFIVNDLYEIFLEKIQYPVASLLKECDFFTPVIHTEAQFLSPLFPGDDIKIVMELEKIGRSSITYFYKIFDTHNKLVGTVKNTHVCTNKKTKQSTPLPEKFVENTKKILNI